MISKFSKYNFVFYILAAFGLLVIFYFSWIDNARLSLTGLLPKFVTNWTDRQENETLRTGVPFLFLGVVVGIKLLLNRMSLRYWMVAFFSLTGIVCIAEVGQLFMPTRYFDFEDIFWGSAASFFGLLLMYIFPKVWNLIKSIK